MFSFFSFFPTQSEKTKKQGKKKYRCMIPEKATANDSGPGMRQGLARMV
jgi:hypothetical protein